MPPRVKPPSWQQIRSRRCPACAGQAIGAVSRYCRRRNTGPVTPWQQPCCHIGLQIHLLVLHAAPQAFHKHIINPPSLAIHADADIVPLKHTGELFTGELAALVGVEYLRRTIGLDSFLQSIDTEAGVERVGYTPRQYLARVPVHDRD